MRTVALLVPCFCIALGALALDTDEAQASTVPYTEVDAAIDSVGLPYVFHAIAQRESNDIPTAVNSWSGACGAFQFLPSTAWAMGYTCWELMDPWVAAIAAKELYYIAGLSPWGY